MKEIKIQVPDGYEGIDEEKSNFAEGKIVFKKKEASSWRNEEHAIEGYYITPDSRVYAVAGLNNDENDHNIFTTKKQAQSMLAMAQLSQIIANDKRFGGPITDEELDNPSTYKHVIFRKGYEIKTDYWNKHYHFLAFHTKEQRDLFMQENMDLIRQYFMLD